MDLDTVLGLEDGYPISNLSGTVVKQWDPVERDGKHGTFVTMNGVLSCDGREVSLQIANPEHTQYNGREVVISAYKNKKGGLSGATRGGYKDKNGNWVDQIKVSGGGIKVIGDQPEPSREPSRKEYGGGMSYGKGNPCGLNNGEFSKLMLRSYNFFVKNGVDADNAAKMATTVGIAVSDGKVTALSEQ